MVHDAGSLPAAAPPPAVPLRKTMIPLTQLKVGYSILFADGCPFAELRSQRCPISGQRQYRFGADSVTSYQFGRPGEEAIYSIAVAEDADGHYLALSRQLTEAEQDQWFGRDALSFFTEPSTAKTIRCKADRATEGAWAGERYVKIVDWVDGTLLGKAGSESAFHYNLLINETGEKAIEIEHYDMLGHNHVYATIYRPVEDILNIAESIPHIPAPAPVAPPMPKTQPFNIAPAHAVPDAKAYIPPAMPKARPDFRRVTEEAIHIAAQPANPAAPTPIHLPEAPPLPSFLMSRSDQQYISLDEVIPPEPVRLRMGLLPAKALIDVAHQQGVRVRDVLRDLLGLESALSEEVLFELPLTEKDYSALAQRYRIRPDARDDIRQRLQEELRSKLLS